MSFCHLLCRRVLGTLHNIPFVTLDIKGYIHTTFSCSWRYIDLNQEIIYTSSINRPYSFSLLQVQAERPWRQLQHAQVDEGGLSHTSSCTASVTNIIAKAIILICSLTRSPFNPDCGTCLKVPSMMIELRTTN